MLATRIIPILLCRGRKLVKGQKFNSWRSVGVAMQSARVHSMRGVDELILLDIGATPEGRGPDIDLVRELSESCFMPLTVGGGVRSIDDADKLVRAGADKVAVCTFAIEHLKFVDDLSSRFGIQAITVSVDVLGNGMPSSRCGSCEHGFSGAVEFSKEVEVNGAGEILLTSVGREGMMNGYDIGLVGDVSNAVNIPVIANGGCSGPDDMIAAVTAGASACAAGALFQFTDWTPKSCAEYMSKKGLEMRV